MCAITITVTSTRSARTCCTTQGKQDNKDQLKKQTRWLAYVEDGLRLGGQALQTRNINQFIDLGIFWNILDYFWNILRYTHLQAHDIAHKVTFSFALQSRRFGRQTGASHNAGATLMSVCRSSGLAPKKGTPFWWLQKPVRHPARRSILMYMTYRYAW